MALTTQERDNIVKLAVGMFNAAPGSTYLQEFTAFFEANGRSLSSLANYFAGSSAYKGIYPNFQSPAEFASTFLTPLGLQANTVATDFVTSRFNKGQSTQSIMLDTLIALDATTDSAFTTAKAILNNKTSVATTYSLTNSALTLSALQAVVSSVDATAASVTAANAANSSASGNTFTLTTGVDITSFNGTMVGAESATDAADTLNTGDTLTGTGSADVLRAIIADTDNPVLTLTGVETVRLEATSAATLNAQSWSGLTTLQVANEGLLNTTTLLTTVQNLRSNATLSLENVGVQTSLDNALAVTYANGSVGSTGTLTIAGNGAGGWNGDGGTAVLAGIAITGNNEVFTKVVLNSTGTNRVEVEAAAADDFNLSEIVVTGSGATSLDFATASVDTVTTVNLSAASGAITLVDTYGAGTVNVTVTGGSGNDTVTVDATRAATVSLGNGNDVLTIANATSALITTLDTFDLGAGTADVLSLTSALAAGLDDSTDEDTAALARITGYERLRISDALNAGTLDIQPFGVSYIEIGSTLTGDEIIDHVANNTTVQFRNAADETDDLILNTITPGGNDDVLNLFLNANIANNASIDYEVQVAGIDTLNITTADRANADNATDRNDGYTLAITNGSDSNLDTMTIVGPTAFSYATTATATNLATVNAGTSTGDITINMVLTTTGEGATITGGSGTNTLTGGGGADTIIGGARDDVLRGSTGTDTLTGGLGNDTFAFTRQANETGGTPSATVFDTITDYALGSDIIDELGGALALTTDAATTAVVGTAAISNLGIATFAAADDTLLEKITAVNASMASGTEADNQVAAFVHSGSTYIYIYDNTADTVDNADGLIKLTGVVATSLTINAGGNLVVS